MDYGTVQFHHDKEHGITYAVDVNFNREDLLESVHIFNAPIEVKLGKSYLHPNDVYCKQTGREVSMAKLIPVKAYLRSILCQGDYTLVTLGMEDYHDLWFRVSKHSEKPHFIRVHDNGYFEI